MEEIQREVLSGGMNLRLFVPVNQLDKIETRVDNLITVEMSNLMIHGRLVKVSTKMIKDENKEYNIYKQLDLIVDDIFSEVGDESILLISLPDVKNEIDETVKITY